ncbi:fumarylacetoacetate hydrolase [Saccharata proteae CBS 121410]|uniref:Fumarylacetoacetase n=1 Tax=Saccharata proteae CBS 121410 TaxID=1314787 RepID=A0A9P4I3M4_9PEZI|nr:fumarylacetoacetate hydrolase [Saccharata proteae CBS 121410]
MGFIPEVPEDCPFTYDNIPFGVFSTEEFPGLPRCGTAIGDYALVLTALDGVYDEDVAAAFRRRDLNAFAALPSIKRRQARQQIIESLRNGVLEEADFVPLKDVKMHMPMEMREYTDFFCSLEHCSNCAPMSGGSIPENFFHAPSAYNGRASSVRPSPHLVRRPRGIFWNPSNGNGNGNGNKDAKDPTYGASAALDFELEMGFIVSSAVPYGSTLSIADARSHIFGFVLLNDWSSRDIQRFEMPPLGPFNSKSFGTTISPWVVTLDALEPFACKPKHEHLPLEHLRLPDGESGTWDVNLKVELVRGGRRYQLCRSNLRYLYWTPFQQITQHASAACGLQVGDLMGTGTISGDGTDEKGEKVELGCLFEATRNGTVPFRFEDGEELGYLKDGDEILLSGWCEDGNGKRILGFGECSGEILPAK